MHTFALISLLAAAVGLSTTQTIVPSSVPISERDQWCVSQQTQCPLLCLQLPGNSAATTSNDCDPTTLAYSCVCENGETPSLANYSLTIPYFECTEWGTQCVAACGQDNICSSNCRSEHPCGAQNPTRVNSTSSSGSTASHTGTASSGAKTTNDATATADYTGFGSGSAAETSSADSSSSSKSAAAALHYGQTYGLAVVLAGAFAGFALLL